MYDALLRGISKSHFIIQNIVEIVEHVVEFIQTNNVIVLIA